MENSEEIRELFHLYVQKRCSAEQARQLFRHFESGKHQAFLEELIDSVIGRQEESTPLGNMRLDSLVNEVHENLRKQISESKIKKRAAWIYRPVFRFAAAAILVVMIIGRAYLLQEKDQEITASSYTNDFLPGGSRAALTLGEGKTIDLDRVKTGLLWEGDGTAIYKSGEGQLVYRQSTALGKTTRSKQYHTLSTPNGGQYEVVLPDGTHIWLNAASSIRYPIHFQDLERRVELIGEAYFEVEKDAEKPFYASGKGYQVKVLGTRFNINSYTNEPVGKITLFEGRIMIEQLPTASGAPVIPDTLAPGEQALIRWDREDAERLTVQDLSDIKSVAPWKEGLFDVEGMDIQGIMRQVARWYDVEIVYEGDIPSREFSGKIFRTANASEVLDGLSYSGIHFRIEGRKIIVLP